jgi:anti-sigma factor RsiW
MHDDLEKRVSAYVDGALRGAKREEFEREVDGDARMAAQIRRSRALSRLVREAWTDGPLAPSPDFLLATIRPALAEIDRERSARPAWQRNFDSALSRLSAVLRPSPVLAAAAAFAFVAALAIMPRLQVGTAMQTNLVAPAPTNASETAQASGSSVASPTPLSPSELVGFTVDGPGSVYDVWPGRPAVLIQSGDGSTTLWVIDDGDLSFQLGSARRWG